MIDLNNLLKDVMARKAQADQVKVDKVKLKDARLSPKTRNEIADKVKEWESAHEYVAVAVVFRQNRYNCACGSTTLAGGQLLRKERHLRIAGTTRYLPVTEWAAGLAQLLDVTELAVVICAECAMSHGFKEAK